MTYSQHVQEVSVRPRRSLEVELRWCKLQGLQERPRRHPVLFHLAVEVKHEGAITGLPNADGC